MVHGSTKRQWQPGTARDSVYIVVPDGQLEVANACHPGMDDEERRRRLLRVAQAAGDDRWRARLAWSPGCPLGTAMDMLDDYGVCPRHRQWRTTAAVWLCGVCIMVLLIVGGVWLHRKKG